MSHPVVVQGGMGVGVSHWALAKVVASAGQLGVVSGTGLDTVFVRRLQLGDPDGDIRRALSHFPVPEVAAGVLDKYFIAGGKGEGEPFKLTEPYTLKPSKRLQQLTVAANFVEVYLAKEGHDGLVGINYLEKIQLPNLASLYGAMLAGVDYIFVGAGIPRTIPAALNLMAAHKDTSLRVHVEGAEPEDDFRIHFSPTDVLGPGLPPLGRPKFVVIVSTATLALVMAKKTDGVDGFIVEGPTAGGHNARPRGPLSLNERGEPIYGPRDIADLKKIRRLGLPFWLAGAYDSPERLREALDAGATGVQVGTSFAFCVESGLPLQTREEVLQTVLSGEADVLTDPVVSPTGFPFKVVAKAGSLAEPAVYEARRRACDLGYLRHVYKKPDGTAGYRCPAEPVADYLRKGGRLGETVGCKCLCNALLANIGLGQIRRGCAEELLVTAGDCLRRVSRFVSPGKTTYSAVDVVDFLLQLV